jgi:signal transduction histidine kinase
LPSAVGSAAYRILQESITNVIRHAGPTRVTVALNPGIDVLEIRVTDDSPSHDKMSRAGHYPKPLGLHRASRT